MSETVEVASRKRDDQFQLTTRRGDTCATPGCDHGSDQHLTCELSGVERGAAVPFAVVAFCTVDCARDFFNRLSKDDSDGYHTLVELSPTENHPTETFIYPHPPTLVTITSNDFEHLHDFASTPRQFPPVTTELLTTACVNESAPFSKLPLEASLEFAPHDEGFTLETASINTLDALNDVIASVLNPYVDISTGPTYSRDWDRHDHPARLRIGDRLPNPDDVSPRQVPLLRDTYRTLLSDDATSPTDLRLSVGPITVEYNPLF